MNTVLNVKIDPTLKSQAQSTAKALGLPLSTVVAVGLREFVRTRSLTISGAPTLKPSVAAELHTLSEQAKRGENLSPAFGTAEESFAWLDSDDD